MSNNGKIIIGVVVLLLVVAVAIYFQRKSKTTTTDTKEIISADEIPITDVNTMLVKDAIDGQKVTKLEKKILKGEVSEEKVEQIETKKIEKVVTKLEKENKKELTKIKKKEPELAKELEKVLKPKCASNIKPNDKDECPKGYRLYNKDSNCCEKVSCLLYPNKSGICPANYTLDDDKCCIFKEENISPEEQKRKERLDIARDEAISLVVRGGTAKLAEIGIKKAAKTKVGKQIAKKVAKQKAKALGKKTAQKKIQSTVKRRLAKRAVRQGQRKMARAMMRAGAKKVQKMAIKAAMKLGKAASSGPFMAFEVASMLADIFDVGGYGAFIPNKNNLDALKKTYLFQQDMAIRNKERFPPLFPVEQAFPAAFKIAQTKWIAEREVMIEKNRQKLKEDQLELLDFGEENDPKRIALEKKVNTINITPVQRDQMIFNFMKEEMGNMASGIKLYPEYSTKDEAGSGISLSQVGVGIFMRLNKNRIQESAKILSKGEAALERFNTERSKKLDNIEKKIDNLLKLSDKAYDDGNDALSKKYDNQVKVLEYETDKINLGPDPNMALPVFSKYYYSLDVSKPSKKQGVSEDTFLDPLGKVENKIRQKVFKEAQSEDVPNMKRKELKEAIPQAIESIDMVMSCESPQATASIASLMSTKKFKVPEQKVNPKQFNITFDPYTGVCRYTPEYCTRMGGLRYRKTVENRIGDCKKTGKAGRKVAEELLGETVTNLGAEIVTIIEKARPRLKPKDIKTIFPTDCKKGYTKHGLLCYHPCDPKNGWKPRGKISLQCARNCPEGAKSDGLATCWGKAKTKWTSQKNKNKDCPVQDGWKRIKVLPW